MYVWAEFHVRGREEGVVVVVWQRGEKVAKREAAVQNGVSILVSVTPDTGASDTNRLNKLIKKAGSVMFLCDVV